MYYVARRTVSNPGKSLFPSKFHRRLRAIKFLANDFDKNEALRSFATDQAAGVYAFVRDVEKYVEPDRQTT